MSAPRPRLVDHLAVLGVLGLTLLAVLPVLLWVPLSPLLRPWVRARLRRRLRDLPAAPAEPAAPDPDAWEGRRLFVVAGEVSGDRLAARVVAAARRRCPGLVVEGYAGPETAAAGARLQRNLVEHAVVGVSAVVRSLGFWWRLCAETHARLRVDPPDAFLTVDFPGLNARLARWARKRRVPVIHLVAPAVWAYMPWRLGRWRRAVDRMLATFGFEAALFGGSRLPTVWVGHPLFEAPLSAPRTGTRWPGGGPCVVELLPGSRRQEIRHHAAMLLEAAADVDAALADAHFRVRLADRAHAAPFEAAAARARRRPETLEIAFGGPAVEPGARPLLGAIAASGTITSELGAALVPMSIYYHVSWLGRLGAFVGLTAPYFGLVNLVAGERVAPERLVVRRRGDLLAHDFLTTAGNEVPWEARRQLLDRLVRRRIATRGVADRAARALFEAADQARSAAPVGDPSTSRMPAGGPA